MQIQDKNADILRFIWEVMTEAEKIGSYEKEFVMDFMARLEAKDEAEGGDTGHILSWDG